jgi:hypothetical protein
MNIRVQPSIPAVTGSQRIGPAVLAAQNRRFCGTGGVSQGNRSRGFAPAFRDSATGAVYLSRLASGTPAPIHVLDGLPDALVIARSASGQVLEACGSVVAGFVRDGCFYSRDEALRVLSNSARRAS